MTADQPPCNDPEYSVDDSRYTPEENKRFEELGVAEDAAKKQLPGNDEQKFAPYFAAANKKIDKLIADANQKKDSINADLKKSIKEVVQDLASTLKTQGFPVNRIANETVHQLKGRASRSWILEILDDEYKDKAHQESARKCKVAPVAERDNLRKGAEHQKQGLPTSSHATTTVAPVAERYRQIMVDVGGHETTDTGSEDLLDEQSSGDLSPSKPTIENSEDSAATPQPQQPQQPQQHLRILIDWDEMSDKMAELHYKDIKNFWLCGRIENHKLLDMVLEREMMPSQEEVVA